MLHEGNFNGKDVVDVLCICRKNYDTKINKDMKCSANRKHKVSTSSRIATQVPSDVPQ